MRVARKMTAASSDEALRDGVAELEQLQLASLEPLAAAPRDPCPQCGRRRSVHPPFRPAAQRSNVHTAVVAKQNNSIQNKKNKKNLTRLPAVAIFATTAACR